MDHPPKYLNALRRNSNLKIVEYTWDYNDQQSKAPREFLYDSTLFVPTAPVLMIEYDMNNQKHQELSSGTHLKFVNRVQNELNEFSSRVSKPETGVPTSKAWLKPVEDRLKNDVIELRKEERNTYYNNETPKGFSPKSHLDVLEYKTNQLNYYSKKINNRTENKHESEKCVGCWTWMKRKKRSGHNSKVIRNKSKYNKSDDCILNFLTAWTWMFD